MNRQELETAIKGLIGPRYWVMEELMALVDQYTGDTGDGYFCNMHGDDD